MENSIAPTLAVILKTGNPLSSGALDGTLIPPQDATTPCCTQTLPSADWTPWRSIYRNLYVTGFVFVKASLHPLRYIHVNSRRPRRLFGSMVILFLGRRVRKQLAE